MSHFVGYLPINLSTTRSPMRKIYLLFFAVTLLAISAMAQPADPQDCCFAQKLLNSDTWSIHYVGGTGYEDDPVMDCSCLDQPEVSSYWLKFDCTEASTLEFIIRSYNGNADFDFALFQGGCPCSENNPGEAVACDNTPAPPGIPVEPTGLGNPAQWGYPGATQFQPGLFMEEGNTYFLMVNNVSFPNEEGFYIEFGPDVHIGQVPKPGPPLVGPTVLCPGSEAQYLTGGNSMFTITWTVDGIVVPTLGSTPVLNWDFPDPGTYEICVTHKFGCSIEFDPSCLTVVVEEIPKTVLSDIICYPPGVYTAPDGNTLSAPGVYDFTFESYLGCDSTVELTLTPAYGNFEIRTDIVCEGDCVEFEGETVCESAIYEKTYTNQFGCDSTIQFNLVVVPLETLIDVEDTLTCKKTSVILDGSLSLGGDSMIYIWTNSVGDTIDTDSITVVTEPGAYTLTTTSFIENGTCTDQNTVEVIADDLPPEEVTAIGDTLSCKVGSVQLFGNSITPDVTYFWSGPNGFTSTEQNPIVSETGNYTLTVTGENGCTDDATAEVIEVIETISASAAGATIDCLNSTVQINGSSPEPNVTYAWEGPGGTVYTEQNPMVAVPGVYTLTVTDVNGCTGTAEAVVGENTTLPEANAIASEALNCNTATVLVSGAGSSFGTEYTYSWSTSDGNIVSDGTTLTPSVNAPGTYTLTVTNTGSGCTNTASAQVEELPTVTAAISSQENVKCFGDGGGAATADGGGGNGSFTYNWSNGGTGQSIDGLIEGMYAVTVTDGDNCTATASVTIIQPDALQTNASATAETMAGANDGTATANPMGGTPGYTYEWSNGETSASINNLEPGNYTVIVTDANGCQSTQTVTVSEVDCFVKANIDLENVSCNGSNDGSATISLDNALEPFSFIWSNDSTTQTVNGLAPGTYTVTATDGNGCEVAASVTIVEPSALSVNATSTDLTFPNSNDGTATASPIGGTMPYSYLWNTTDTTPQLTSLPVGEYTVTVTDKNGCTESQTVTVESFGCTISLSLEGEDVSCFEGSDGQATALPAAGVAPFQYVWSNGDTTSTIGNLPAGTYGVVVMDSTNCPATGEITIGEPLLLELAVTGVTPADCGGENGSASVAASGGTPGYTYEWPGGQTDSLATGLSPGTYVATVTDGNGCTAEVGLEVGQDNTNDTEPPVAMAQDITVELDASGQASITVADIDNGSSDNCGITSMELDLTSFDCGNLDENTVTLTVTDVGGNMVSTTAVVTVLDNISPTISCPDNIVAAYCDPVATFEVAVADNCSAGLMATQTGGLPSGSEFPAGEATTQTFEVTDDAGNSANCEFTVDVSDSVAVNAAGTDVFCFGEADGSATTSVTGGVLDYTYLWSNDSTTASIFGLDPGIYSVTVTDGNGCEEMEEVEVFEPENLVTSLVNIINETGANQNGAVDVTISGGTMPYTYEWSDLDGNVVGNMEDVSGLAAGTYQLFVTDDNGCVSSSAYTIQNTTATYDPTLQSKIRLFPNPAKDWVTIELIGVPVTEIEVTAYDVVGKLAYTNPHAKLSHGRFLLDLSSFPEGAYIIKLNVDGQVVAKRMIKGL